MSRGVDSTRRRVLAVVLVCLLAGCSGSTGSNTTTTVAETDSVPTATTTPTDSDGDGLADREEREAYGTDPSRSDTDGDSLSDGFEAGLVGADPLVGDTDGDGTPDGREDADRDTLSNAGEQRLGTDPLAVDTDGDGIGDRAERGVGFDPTTADSDGDGVADGDEVVEHDVSNAATGVSLVARGSFESVRNVEIRPKPSYFADNEVDRSPAVRVVSGQGTDGLANVTITLPLSDRVPRAEYRNLSVYKWDGTRTGRYRAIDSAAANGSATATATVDGSAYFVVLHTPSWIDATTATFE